MPDVNALALEMIDLVSSSFNLTLFETGWGGGACEGGGGGGGGGGAITALFSRELSHHSSAAANSALRGLLTSSKCLISNEIEADPIELESEEEEETMVSNFCPAAVAAARFWLITLAIFCSSWF